MSKYELNEYVDDRYSKMAERLEVRWPRLLLSVPRSCSVYVDVMDRPSL